MLRDQLSELLGPVVAGLGYELWELEFAPRAGGGLLRLYIDSADGITLDDCERVSRAVSDRLDEEDPIAGRYTLEAMAGGMLGVYGVLLASRLPRLRSEVAA